MRLGIADRPIAVTSMGRTAAETMRIDPATGYLVGDKTKFTPELKAKFIHVMRDLFPNVYAACEMIGISYSTVAKHLAIDQKLSAQMVEIKQRAVDQTEGDIFTFAKRPQNFMDRIAIMRAYRGELYNPKSTVIHEKSMAAHELAQRRTGLAGAIDVEVISASAEILDAEIVPDSQVPDPDLAAPDSTPLSGEAVTANPSVAEANASGARDPLLDMEE